MFRLTEHHGRVGQDKCAYSEGMRLSVTCVVEKTIVILD